MTSTQEHSLDPSLSRDQDEGRCYFLELPAELRLQICQTLLCPEKVYIFSYDTPTILDISHDCASRSRFYGCVESDPVHPQILRVCAQVHKESLPLLYQLMELHLEPSQCAPHIGMSNIALMRRFPLYHLAPLTTIPRLSLTLPIAKRTEIEDIAHSVILGKSIRGGLQVHQLNLCVGEHELLDWDDIDSLQSTVIRMVSAYTSVVAVRECYVFSGQKQGDCDGKWHWHKRQAGVWEDLNAGEWSEEREGKW